MRWVVASHRDLERVGFRRYLYSGQRVASEIMPTEFGQGVLIACEDDRIAENLVDRYGSGLIGARMFDTELEATEYLQNL